MASISRRLPRTKISRQQALNEAKQKADSLGGAPPQLTAATLARLNAIQPLYNQAMLDVSAKRALLSDLVVNKNAAKIRLRKLCKAFIKTFNNGVDIDIFPKAHRAFYGLDVSTGNLPAMGRESELKQVARQLVDGDANRVDPAQGNGDPMAIPDIGMVQTALTDFLALDSQVSNAKDALDAAQENVDSHNAEADGTILKVWDEVETYYNEEEKESQRANAREWGVVYVLVGVKTTKLNISATFQDTGLPAEGAEGFLEGPDVELVLDENGKAQDESKFIGTVNFTLQSPGYEIIQDSFEYTEDGGTINKVYELVPLTP